MIYVCALVAAAALGMAAFHGIDHEGCHDR